MSKIKLTPKEFKEKIMAQQLNFHSRFLDISMDELCGYSKEQIEKMLDCTIEQMPEDMLYQFEVELTGGKREF